MGAERALLLTCDLCLKESATFLTLTLASRCGWLMVSQTDEPPKILGPECVKKFSYFVADQAKRAADKSPDAELAQIILDNPE